MNNGYTITVVDYNNSQHCSHLAEMLIAYSGDLMGGGVPLALEHAEKSIQLMGQKKYATSFLAYYQDTPVGLANCFESFSSFAGKAILNIHDFAIVPEHRGKGLSQSLLQAVEDFAVKNKMAKITLEVLEGNEAAKGAYLKFGFDGYELDPQMGKALFWQKKLQA